MVAANKTALLYALFVDTTRLQEQDQLGNKCFTNFSHTYLVEPVPKTDEMTVMRTPLGMSGYMAQIAAVGFSMELHSVQDKYTASRE